MTDDEWEKQRNRAIAAAFQTGRPTFADSEGEMRFADGDQEVIPADIGGTPMPLPLEPPTQTIYTKAMRAVRFAFVASIVTAALNMVLGFWRPWHFAYAAVLLCSALVWRYVHRKQRALYGAPK